jgi:hypothetical protein
MHLISALLLGAAFVFDTRGCAGVAVLLGAGVGCEIWFWMRTARVRRSSRAPRAV